MGEIMNEQDVNKPWHMLSESIKSWVYKNGYVIRETAGSVTYYSGWQEKYLAETGRKQ
jgi:hypothetical protein